MLSSPAVDGFVLFPLSGMRLRGLLKVQEEPGRSLEIPEEIHRTASRSADAATGHPFRPHGVTCSSAGDGRVAWKLD